MSDAVADRIVAAGASCTCHTSASAAIRRRCVIPPACGTAVSPVALAGSLHLGLATPNFAIQEYMGYPDASHEVFRHAWSYSDGHLHPGEAPGLGIEVDEVLAARFPYGRAHLAVARRRDGTLTDW